MKKILILIIVISITLVSIVFVKYADYSRKKTKIKSINNEYLAYQNSDIKINTIVSLMNKAIEQNKKNNIEQDENDEFKENDTDSIKIYLKTESNNETVKIPMERLILNEKAGVEKVEYAFSDLIFKAVDIEYHSKTGQIKSVTFEPKK